MHAMNSRVESLNAALMESFAGFDLVGNKRTNGEKVINYCLMRVATDHSVDQFRGRPTATFIHSFIHFNSRNTITKQSKSKEMCSEDRKAISNITDNCPKITDKPEIKTFKHGKK